MRRAIKALRVKAEISQNALAELLGITQGAVSQWETGRTLPSVDSLPALAKVLDCSIDDIDLTRSNDKDTA